MTRWAVLDQIGGRHSPPAGLPGDRVQRRKRWKRRNGDGGVMLPMTPWGRLQQLVGGAVKPFHQGRQLAWSYLVELPPGLQSPVEPGVMQTSLAVGREAVGCNAFAV